MAHEINFEVIESLDGFYFSDKFISLVVGPIGSVKTTAGIMKILYHASRMAPGKDGVRRSKAVWVRNTREQLRDTSIPDFLKWIPDGVMGAFLKTEYKFQIRVGDIDCEVLFRGLDESKDVRRLLSLNASFFIFDEFREIHQDIFETAQGRVGRYPDMSLVPHNPEWGLDEKGNPIGGCVTDDGKPNKHVWGMSNPPDVDTYWEDLLTNPPENTHVTIQPSGLSPEADWIRFLPSDYYDNLAQGKTQDWIDVYINAEFGKSLSGQPVFRAFSRDNHVAKHELTPRGAFVGTGPIIIGVDAGLTPAAVFGQVTYDGRLVIYDALASEESGALRFIREKVKPLLANRYPGAPVIVVVDPAATQRAQTDERTVKDIYQAEGFTVRPARTNALAARLAAVDKYLTRVVDGKFGLLIDPVNALPLIKALSGKYRYKINTKGEKDEKPEKSHPWSDLCDGLQYLCLHADGGAVFGFEPENERRREIARVSSAGWT